MQLDLPKNLTSYMNAPLRRFPIIIVSHWNVRIFYNVFFYTRNKIFKFELFINYRRTWSARLLVSGNVTSKIAVSPSPEVLGPIQPLLQPQSDLPSEDWEKWRTCKKCSLFLFSACVSTKKEWIKRNKKFGSQPTLFPIQVPNVPLHTDTFGVMSVILCIIQRT